METLLVVASTGFGSLCWALVLNFLYWMSFIVQQSSCRGREPVALFQCGVAIRVLCPFLMKPRVSLQFVTVKLPGHIHL